jgi:hypothetical protein
MKALGFCICMLLATSGCFTTWAGLRVSGLPGAPDENKREETVPQPGIQEHLVVTLAGNKLECSSAQVATDTVYRSAYRYGTNWKIATGVMFLAEALSATALMLESPDAKNHAEHLLGGAFLGVDALGTGVLFFAPRKEIYDHHDQAITTTISSVCPEGLALEIASETYPIDGRGSIGELGEAALDDWMHTPNGSLLVDFNGRTAPLRTDMPSAVFSVPAGTLAQVALP